MVGSRNRRSTRDAAISGTYAYWASHDLLVRALMEDAPAAARALEELRLAEARLERRREAAAEPSALDRIVLRLVLAAADGGEPTTPSVLAAHVGLTRPAMSQTLARLEADGLVQRRAHPTDGRSRIVVPASRDHRLEDDDMLTDRIRAAAARLTVDQGAVVVDFIDELRRIIDDAPPASAPRSADD